MKDDVRMEWKLKRIRKKIKLIEIAERVGVSPTAISLYESAQRDMMPDNARRYRSFIDETE